MLHEDITWFDLSHNNTCEPSTSHSSACTLQVYVCTAFVCTSCHDFTHLKDEQQKAWSSILLLNHCSPCHTVVKDHRVGFSLFPVKDIHRSASEFTQWVYVQCVAKKWKLTPFATLAPSSRATAPPFWTESDHLSENMQRHQLNIYLQSTVPK